MEEALSVYLLVVLGREGLQEVDQADRAAGEAVQPLEEEVVVSCRLSVLWPWAAMAVPLPDLLEVEAAVAQTYYL